MPEIVGIKFRKCGKVYDFESEDREILKGDLVVVESSFGLTLGNVVKERRFIETSDRPIKKIIRKATSEDVETKAENNELENTAAQFCLERIHARELPMKLVRTEATLDKRRIVFYFTADGRIDFRELVKDLATRFKTRIEMRQIGVRDEAKFIGGLGICGRETCCTTFLTNFSPISIRMAKRQELVLNLGKLSGLCGRLMCCLGYEMGNDHFDEEEDGSETISITDENGDILFVDDEDKPIERKGAKRGMPEKEKHRKYLIKQNSDVKANPPDMNKDNDKKGEQNYRDKRRKKTYFNKYEDKETMAADAASSHETKNEAAGDTDSDQKRERRGKYRGYKKKRGLSK